MNVPLKLPYFEVMLRELEIVGSFMYSRAAPAEIASMLSVGLIDLEWVDLHVHPLAAVDAAIQEAAQLDGLSACVLNMAD